ncbi:MAG: DUF4337 domain-containing protein [Bacteroidetes bacterium]|nr:DUF4337 domain-containing protein [Bacteroidota bacterium]
MSESIEKSERNANRFELLCGLLLAVFAAILAVMDLGAGKYGDDEIMAKNESASAYQWYQSKTIKQSLVENQKDLIQLLLSSNMINSSKTDSLDAYQKGLGKDLKRYKKEKKEIMEGSAKIGKENWIQDKDGKLGEIIGAKEWENKANILGSSGDVFDLSTLFLQISLVVGAISLVLQMAKMKKVFMILMIVLGSIGTYYGITAYLLAMSA